MKKAAKFNGRGGYRQLLIAVLFAVLLCGTWFSSVEAGSDAERFFENGKRFMNLGDYVSAVKFYTKALSRVEPNKRNAHTVRLARAQAYLSSGDMQPAAQDIATVLRMPGLDEETNASALRLRGSLNLKQGRYKQALSCFTDALKIRHDDNELRSTCYTDRGITWLNMGKPSKAIDDLTQAVRLNPKSGHAYAARSMAYLREDRIEAARRDSEKALALKPGGQAEKLAGGVLRQLTFSASGPSSVEVPLDDRGHMMVQVRFSKRGTPHLFMLDTGATYSLIDEELLQKLRGETQVERVGQARAQTADGSLHALTLYKVKNAFIHHLPLGEIIVGVPDRPRGKLTYLLGVKSLRNIRITIDNATETGEITITGRSAEAASMASRKKSAALQRSKR